MLRGVSGYQVPTGHLAIGISPQHTYNILQYRHSYGLMASLFRCSSPIMLMSLQYTAGDCIVHIVIILQGIGCIALHILLLYQGTHR